MIFEDSDKKKSDAQSLNFELDLVDLDHEFNSELQVENLLFGKLRHDEVYDMFIQSGIINKLNERGYTDFIFTTEPISSLDNRIFVKTNKEEVLIHIRLKIADFFIKKINEYRKMIYIDWLLTQNIHFTEKKFLFPGQEFTGLNVFKELTQFIYFMYSKMNCYGVFNVPEYFHDAVLFMKNFKYVDPKKQGYFEALLSNFKKFSIRKISNLIQDNKIFFEDGTEFKWFHSEMMDTEDIFLRSILFDSKYFENKNKFSTTKFLVKE
jgi:hypothetical protein